MKKYSIRQVLLVATFVSITHIAWSQQYQKTLSQADSLYGLGVAIGNEGVRTHSMAKIDSVLLCFQEALRIRKALLPPNDIKIGDCLAAVARTLINKKLYDEAYQSLTEAIQISKANKNLKFSANAHFLMADVFARKNMTDSSIYYFQTTLNNHFDMRDSSSYQVSRIYNNLGNMYHLRCRYDDAMNCFKQCYDLKKKLLKPNHLEITFSGTNLGAGYLDRGDYDNAFQVYTEGLKVTDLYTPKNSIPYYQARSLALANFGDYYLRNSQYHLSIDYFKKAIDVKKLYDSGETIAPDYDGASDGLLHIGQLDSALQYAQNALSVRQKLLVPTHQEIAQSYQKIGSILTKKRDFDSALSNLQKAYTMLKEKYGNNHVLISDVLNDMSVLYLEKRQYDSAVLLSQYSLYSLNYNKALNFENVLSLSQLILRLKHLGGVYEVWYEEKKDKHLLDKAVDSYSQALESIKALSKSFNTEGAKVAMKTVHYPVYEKTLHTLAELDNVNKYQKMLDCMEQSKSNALIAEMQTIKASAFSSIPTAFKEKENVLRASLIYNEKQRLANRADISDSLSVQLLSEQIDLRQEYESLKLYFEKNYPDYHKLKYGLSSVRLEEVQTELISPYQSILSFFVGDTSIFLMVINNTGTTVKEIEKDFPLDSLVQKMLSGIYDYHVSNNKTDDLKMRSDTRYTEGGYILYEKLIAPIKNELKNNIIIIPDGILNYIPFEALLIQKPKQAYRYLTHRYFADEYTISYATSATLLREMRQKEHRQVPTKKWLGFAPFCNGDTTLTKDLWTDVTTNTSRTDIKPLPNAGKEIANAKALMQGDALYGEAASIKAFNDLTPQYRIIHLATHAKANDRTGDFSFLVFNKSQDSTQNELLYARDLYNTTLNADMVVISACETGIGQLRRGEGVSSLARAFTFAGAKSIITTLWQVNDAASKDLMIDFYKNLHKNQPKDEALWRAKQKIRRNDSTASPYFWAGFIGMGDMRRLEK